MDPTTKLTDQQAGRLAQLTLKQQVNAIDIERISRDMQLRQWCIEEANKVCGGGSPLTQIEQQEDGRLKVDFSTVHLAQQIYNFVTAPFREPSGG